MSTTSSPATISDRRDFTTDELVDLYDSVGWHVYSKDPGNLAHAIANSTYVVTARVDERLVGLARGLSDDASIFYLQDILVRPEHRRIGIGRALLLRCLDRFAHVRTKMLLTDDLPEQHSFYEAAGYVDTRRITNLNLHAFIRMEGIELEAD